MDKQENGKAAGQAEEELLSQINSSLSKQINEQFEMDVVKETEWQSSTKKNRKVPLWFKVSTIVFAVILLVGVGSLLWLNSLYGNMNYEDGTEVKQEAEIFEQDEDAIDLEEVDPNAVKWDETTDGARKDENVINILLVGEESINDGDSRGRTDSIMIATINKKEKAIKLTSVMRDTYVQIPGYSDNKLNAAYHSGGMPLLVDTIKRNFDVEVDGYVLVDFDGFETIIDKLGGVEVELSNTEANYLNRTNYISNPANRNVSAGKRTLNGNQALGYARVRYVPNGNLSDDFGRTSRQREVLNAIFEKYKSKSAIELIAMLPDMLQLVTTNIQKDEFMNYITTVVTLGPSELETFRLPIDEGYKNTRIRGMSVLLPDDLQSNIDALHKFVFGDEVQVSSPSPSVTTQN